YESLLPWPLRGLRDLLVASNQAFELLHVVIRHSRSRKALFKHFTTPFSAQLSCLSHRVYRIFQAFNDEAGMTLLHKLGNRAAAIGDDGCAAGHRLNHH